MSSTGDRSRGCDSTDALCYHPDITRRLYEDHVMALEDSALAEQLQSVYFPKKSVGTSAKT